MSTRLVPILLVTVYIGVTYLSTHLATATPMRSSFAVLVDVVARTVTQPLVDWCAVPQSVRSNPLLIVRSCYRLVIDDQAGPRDRRRVSGYVTFLGLPEHEHVEVRFRSRGCFHHTDYLLTFRVVAGSMRMRVTPMGMRALVTPERQLTLDGADVEDLERLLGYYRRIDGEGFCTTRDELSFALYRHGILVAREEFVDATCDLYFGDRVSLLSVMGRAQPRVGLGAQQAHEAGRSARFTRS